MLKATFALRNLETGETIARPRLLLPQGESGTIEVGREGRVFRFVVDATKETRVRYEVTFVAGGRELVISRGSFARGTTVAQPGSSVRRVAAVAGVSLL